MGASVDFQGKKEFVKMWSYGVGVYRLVGAIIEAKYDDKNEIMNWPISVTPYECAIIPLINKNDNSIKSLLLLLRKKNLNNCLSLSRRGESYPKTCSAKQKRTVVFLPWSEKTVPGQEKPERKHSYCKKLFRTSTLYHLLQKKKNKLGSVVARCWAIFFR